MKRNTRPCARGLRRRLEQILEVLERSDDPSVEELTQIMEVIQMHETYYTPEQRTQLEVRRKEVGEDQIAAVEREWAELSAQMKAHRNAGPESVGHLVSVVRDTMLM